MELIIVAIMLGLIFLVVQHLKQDIGVMRREFSDSLWKVAEKNIEQSREGTKLIKDVTEELVKMSEGQKQVLNVTEQLKNLQELFQNPRQRGVIGEFYLEHLLQNLMPPNSYQMQYSFPNGTIVDAAIFVGDKLIVPIDSKFSLENYNRIVDSENQIERDEAERAFIKDIKSRISETAKYIQPKEGTANFALMFIPHETIYYDLLMNKVGTLREENETLVEMAVRRHQVVIVSPTLLAAYLQTIIQGLRAMEIEESAKMIQKRVEELSFHLKRYEESVTSMGRSLGATLNHYNRSVKEFNKIDRDLYKITGRATPSQIEELGDKID